MGKRSRPKRAFVAARLHLANAEIAQQSVAAGLNMTARQVRSHRFALKDQGVTTPQPEDETPEAAPRAAPKRAFVAARLHLSSSEIIEQAAAEGIELTATQVANHRHTLKKAGVTGSARAAYPKRQPPKRQSTFAPADPVDPKETQFKRLCFELGFDRARKLWLQIQDLHDRMKGD